MHKKLNRLLLILLVIIIAGFLPATLHHACSGCHQNSYACQNSSWFHPLGKSITHKGVDISLLKKVHLYIRQRMDLVVYKGKYRKRRQCSASTWTHRRLHYYAHLDTHYHWFIFTGNNQYINWHSRYTGNAAGKPSHLHLYHQYPLFHPWKIDGRQGWKKMFYLQSNSWPANQSQCISILG